MENINPSLFRAVVVEEIAINDHDPKYDVQHANMSAKEFLMQYPPGAYTAGRTLGTLSLVDLPGHIKRLAHSLQKMSFASIGADEDPQCKKLLDPFRDEHIIHTRLIPLMSRALAEWLAGSPSARKTGQVEAKVTVLITYTSQRGLQLIAHCDELLGPKTPTCDVAVHGPPRKNPTAKDSQWVRDRADLEELFALPAGEVLLSDPEQNIYEGLTSNFCAVCVDEIGQPYIETAPLEHVLAGTILHLVVTICQKLGIRFEFRFPKLDSAATWLGAFITSNHLVC
ncbi:hypothetical protein DFS34DRAFT_227531 [Phlyctochytrium arcticum]|nr:hypothetical protein DFS34DRAFT_227531 [Phlyctochytrium arcticum]